MKHNKRLLAVIGIALSCQLTLTACQHHSNSPKTEHSKTHKVEKKASKAKTEKAQKKEIPGIDTATDDGFLFSSESQIETKTDEGLVVKHGNHSHFLFYSDLKGTKWDYLVPKDYKDKKSATNKTQSRQVGNQSASQTGDGYVFNPKDIVAEDANGYTVRHGDHYHYILKSSLNQAGPATVSPSHQATPIAPQYRPTHAGNGTSHHTQTGTQQHKPAGKQEYPGIHFATDDHFLFDGKHVIDKNDFGLLVAHNGNRNDIHAIPYYQLVNTQWENLIPKEYLEKARAAYKGKPQDKPNEPEKTITPIFEQKIEEKIKKIMQEYGLSRDKISIDQKKNQILYPHGNHFHAEPIDASKPFTDPFEPQPDFIDGESFEDRKERLIKEYMERFKVNREDITVEGNYMSVRHGDHAHIYKIDPQLPDDPERDVKTESTNLEVENQLVYGPLFTENSKVSLTRKGVVDTFHPAGIKNFVLLTFSTNSDYGNFEVDGKQTKRVYYLVRKDLNWEDLHITRPKAVTLKGNVFKGWSADLPKSGKIPREHQAYYVDFDRVRKQPTKAVYTPNDDVRDIDVSHYVPVKYTTLLNGRLKFGDKIQGGFTFYVNPQLTWAQAKQAGLEAPTPVPHKNYEFIEYRNIVDGSEDENSKVSTMISLAAFGSTAPYLGPYIATNPNNPTDIHDPNRHPNYYWHDPKNYVAVAFKIDEGGQLISRAGRGQTVVYLVRKGISLADANILPPFIQAAKDYQSAVFTAPADYYKPVTEDKVYHMRLEKKTAPKPDKGLTKPSGSPANDFATPNNTDNSVGASANDFAMPNNTDSSVGSSANDFAMPNNTGNSVGSSANDFATPNNAGNSVGASANDFATPNNAGNSVGSSANDFAMPNNTDNSVGASANDFAKPSGENPFLAP
ncbi:pneumococcal-type histidine triad protein [Streptococcus gallinaceus]|uniref:Histidine triad protein n=1 Tax=Streptococcus gallinaceus TaxID=165758 RepID=A0ABV2JNU0_9STRE